MEEEPFPAARFVLTEVVTDLIQDVFCTVFWYNGTMENK